MNGFNRRAHKINYALWKAEIIVIKCAKIKINYLSNAFYSLFFNITSYWVFCESAQGIYGHTLENATDI